jgi:hypothetical protein
LPAVLGTAAGLPALPIEIIRSTSTSTAANHEANPLEAGEHRRPAEAVVEHVVPIWVSPSTAMPTAASWWTRG